MSEVDGIAFSLVVPIYRNEANIDALFAAIDQVIAPTATRPFEVVFVVDGSPDRSWQILAEQLQRQAWPSQLIALSRNFGASSAIRTGLECAKGRAVAVLPADLQEPAELVPRFWEILDRDEADVVCAARTGRHDGWLANAGSATFWWLYRKLVLADMPRGGVGAFAINTRVRNAVLAIPTPNMSLLSQVLWVGFRRRFIPTVRQARRAGVSGYSYSRKFAFALETLVSFSQGPMLLQIWLGLLGVVVSILAGAGCLVAWSAGWISSGGHLAIALLIVIAFSVLLMSQGLLGLHLWRTFENTKLRPLSIVSEHLTFAGRTASSDDAERR